MVENVHIKRKHAMPLACFPQITAAQARSHLTQIGPCCCAARIVLDARSTAPACCPETTAALAPSRLILLLSCPQHPRRTQRCPQQDELALQLLLAGPVPWGLIQGLGCGEVRAPQPGLVCEGLCHTLW